MFLEEYAEWNLSGTETTFFYALMVRCKEIKTIAGDQLPRSKEKKLAIYSSLKPI